MRSEVGLQLVVCWCCWCLHCLHESSWEGWLLKTVEGLRAAERWFVPQSQQICLKMEAVEAVEGRQSLQDHVHRSVQNTVA